MASCIGWVFGAIALVVLCHAAPDRRNKVKWTSCGPPLNVTVEPNPIRIRQDVKITVEIEAAHDMVAGTVDAYINTWPYHINTIFCKNGKTFDSKGSCIIKKGEKRVFSRSLWVDDKYTEMEYIGNATLTNSKNQVMACIQFSFMLYDE